MLLTQFTSEFAAQSPRLLPILYSTRVGNSGSPSSSVICDCLSHCIIRYDMKSWRGNEPRRLIQCRGDESRPPLRLPDPHPPVLLSESPISGPCHHQGGHYWANALTFTLLTLALLLNVLISTMIFHH